MEYHFFGPSTDTTKRNNTQFFRFFQTLLIFLLTSATVFSQEPVDKESEAPAQYSFEYHVNNPETGDIKSQNEIREGDVVHGQYGLVEPDGSVRTVEYTADDQNGFRAVVHKTGGPEGANELPKALLPPNSPPQEVPAFPEISTDEIPVAGPEFPEIKPELPFPFPSATKAPEPVKPSIPLAVTSAPVAVPPNPFAVTPKSVATNTVVPPLGKYPYLYPYYKYPHPWTLYNLYKTHPVYRYSLLHPAHPANPLYPLHPAHPANPLSPLHPAHPANPINSLSPYSALHPLYNPLYHV